MIKKALASTVILLTLFSVYAYALDFSYSADILNKGAQKYKAVKLTPEIYNSLDENMADIMLFDRQNEAVPYFINSFTEIEKQTNKTYELKLSDSFQKDGFYYFDYILKNPQEEDVTATSIEVQTDSRGFAKRIELWGSYDSTNWEKVQDDILYDVDGNVKLAVTFAGTKKYTCYRFKIQNNLEQIRFSSAALKYNGIARDKEYFINTFTPGFTVEEKEKTTVVRLQGLKNLKLDSVTLETDSVFKRKVYFDGVQSKVLYNLTFKDINYRDATIPLNSYKASGDVSEIVIDNKDDRPIEISGIMIRYIQDELVFDGSKSESFTLKFGSSEIQNPKSYDIASYREQILEEGYDVLDISRIKGISSAKPVQLRQDYKLVFNIVFAAVALVMGIIIFSRLKR